ncbi:MAG: hypothetical protein ACLQF0_06915 [Dissulfurispiraceae bacterium]
MDIISKALEVKNKVRLKVRLAVDQVVHECRMYRAELGGLIRPEKEDVLCSHCRSRGGWPRCKRSRLPEPGAVPPAAMAKRQTH